MLAALSIVAVAALAEGCVVGRNLYLVEDQAATDEVNAATTGEAGVTPAPGDDNADGGGGGNAPPGPNPDPKLPDASAPDGAVPPGPGPGPVKPMCVGGTAVEVEPNGGPELAKPLAVGKTCANLTLGDTDWFNIDVPKDGLFRVSFEAEGDARLLVQSAAGGVAFATGTGGSFNFTTSGLWNLRVVSDTGRVQTYALVRP